MPQFKAKPDTDYYNPVTGQTVRYSASDLASEAIGSLSSQFVEGTKPSSLTPTQTAPTVPTQQAQIPGVAYNADGTRTAYDEYLESVRPESPDQRAAREAQLRAERQAFMQQQVNAVNAMYADILRKTQIAGVDRMGSTAVQQALSGQRGSPSGQAGVDRTSAYNIAEETAVHNEHAAKIAEIMSDFEFRMDQTIREERELRSRDADAWIEYQKNSIDRHRGQGADLRAQFVNAMLEPENIDEATWLKLAEAGGYSVPQVKALYDAEYRNAVTEWTLGEQQAIANIKQTQASTAAVEDQTATRREEFMIGNGFIYLKTPTERKQYEDQGRKTVKIGGREYLAPDDTATTIVETNGRVKLINAQTGQTIADLGSSKSVSGSGIMTQNEFYDAASVNMQAAMAEMFATGENVSGGYLAPSAWNSFRKQWITQVGSPGEFDKRFDSYIDPAQTKLYEKGGRAEEDNPFK